MSLAGSNFFLAFSALFAIVNPIGAALIFSQITADRAHPERIRLARRIALYSAAVMLGTLWVGSYVLAFFGITVDAVRIAGGLIVASRAWALLNQPEHMESRKQRQAEPAVGEADVAFYPLTIPFTAGPGTISVALTLGAERPPGGLPEVAVFFIASSLAAVAVAITVWLLYAAADRVESLLGANGTRIVGRLTALLMVTIGVQIMLGGILDVLRPLLATH